MGEDMKTVREVTVGRITMGHGDSSLGFAFELNYWGETNIVGLKEGDKLKVTVEKLDV